MNKLYVNIMKLEKYFNYVIQETNTIYMHRCTYIGADEDIISFIFKYYVSLNKFFHA